MDQDFRSIVEGRYNNSLSAESGSQLRAGDKEFLARAKTHTDEIDLQIRAAEFELKSNFL